jgi:hypothetical protein
MSKHLMYSIDIVHDSCLVTFKTSLRTEICTVSTYFMIVTYYCTAE